MHHLNTFRLWHQLRKMVWLTRSLYLTEGLRVSLVLGLERSVYVWNILTRVVTKKYNTGSDEWEKTEVTEEVVQESKGWSTGRYSQSESVFYLLPVSGSSGLGPTEHSAWQRRLDPKVLWERNIQRDLEEPVCGSKRRSAVHQRERGESEVGKA